MISVADEPINPHLLQPSPKNGVDPITYDLGNGVNFGDGFVEVKLSASGGEAWKDREAAVLALGAIAEGCISVLYPHLCEEIDLQNNNQLLRTKVVMIISFLLVCACVAVFIVKLV
ncbi:hypothetical protein LWI29_028839 [Acer saccharum]|uniref:Uncharacterized protein n=1 Tax=Acer saccharum TaxID=4024 RepID=A0AA39VLP5_ACESA|nr:hypothetical protein LWI29_028839 [Acer saccharum]